MPLQPVTTIKLTGSRHFFPNNCESIIIWGLPIFAQNTRHFAVSPKAIDAGPESSDGPNSLSTPSCRTDPLPLSFGQVGGIQLKL
jgi:hypothetical protein